MAKYRIKLTEDEVNELTSIIKKGSHSTLTYRAALVLLNCDECEYNLGKSTHQEISNVLKIGKPRLLSVAEVWKVQSWVIPPEQNAEFVAHMEQVLDVYKRPYNEENPVVCTVIEPVEIWMNLLNRW
jgi:hypothetical protein